MSELRVRLFARPGEIADEPILDALEAFAAEVFPGSGFSVREERDRTWGRVWVAEQDGAPVGMLMGWHVADEVHVLQVAAMTHKRRCGVGEALLRSTIDYALLSGVRVLVLEVGRKNTPAHRLYRARGFAGVCERRAPSDDDGDDAVEMMLPIDPRTGAVMPSKDLVNIDV